MSTKFQVGHIAPLVKAAAHERVLLLAGQPGTGKTSFAHWLAGQVGAGVATYLCHAWSGDEDLFNGVDIAAVVAGDAATAVRPGVLRAVAEASHQERVVLLIDELDKAPARFEALLLGFLERWEYPLAPGHVGTANPRNVWVVLTHNGTREISAPLQRRAFRYTMPFLPEAAEISALGGGKLATALVKLATAMRHDGTLTSPALSELRRAMTLIPLADNASEARDFALGCLAKSDADAEFVGKRAASLLQIAREAVR